MTKSESLFEHYCETNGVPCRRVPESTVCSPDYMIQLGDAVVVCEIKQLDMGHSERQAWSQLREKGHGAFFVPHRLRQKLKNVSRQVKSASTVGTPTILVVFDNTMFGGLLSHDHVIQAMYGRVRYPIRTTSNGEPTLGAPFLGGNRAFTPTQNTAVSALAVLEEVSGALRLRVYHNLHAAVQLDPRLLDGLAVDQRIMPGDTSIEVWA